MFRQPYDRLVTCHARDYLPLVRGVQQNHQHQHHPKDNIRTDRYGLVVT